MRLLHIDRLANNALFNTWGRAQHEADEVKFLAGEKELSGKNLVTPLRSVWKDEDRQVRYLRGLLTRRLSALISQGSVHPSPTIEASIPKGREVQGHHGSSSHYNTTEPSPLPSAGNINNQRIVAQMTVTGQAHGGQTTSTSRRTPSQGDAGQREATNALQYGGTFSPTQSWEEDH